MKIVCFNCQVDMKISKAGTPIIEYFMNPPQPYRILYAADMYSCACCALSVAVCSGRVNTEHFQDGFSDELEKVLSASHAKSYERCKDKQNE